MANMVNGAFWRLSRPAQISMWLIGLVIGVLLIIIGRESVNTEVRANGTAIEIHEVRINRIEKDASELKGMIQDIHRIIMRE